jgi:hypothetical protein
MNEKIGEPSDMAKQVLEGDLPIPKAFHANNFFESSAKVIELK